MTGLPSYGYIEVGWNAVRLAAIAVTITLIIAFIIGLIKQKRLREGGEE